MRVRRTPASEQGSELEMSVSKLPLVETGRENRIQTRDRRGASQLDKMVHATGIAKAEIVRRKAKLRNAPSKVLDRNNAKVSRQENGSAGR